MSLGGDPDCLPPRAIAGWAGQRSEGRHRCFRCGRRWPRRLPRVLQAIHVVKHVKLVEKKKNCRAVNSISSRRGCRVLQAAPPTRLSTVVRHRSKRVRRDMFQLSNCPIPNYPSHFCSTLCEFLKTQEPWTEQDEAPNARGLTGHEHGDRAPFVSRLRMLWVISFFLAACDFRFFLAAGTDARGDGEAEQRDDCSPRRRCADAAATGAQRCQHCLIVSTVYMQRSGANTA